MFDEASINLKCPNCEQDNLIPVYLTAVDTGLIHQKSAWCPSCDLLQDVEN